MEPKITKAAMRAKFGKTKLGPPDEGRYQIAKAVLDSDKPFSQEVKKLALDYVLNYTPGEKEPKRVSPFNMARRV